ncbi:hypothetical protein CVT24_006457 [Panaeolus cyanescens]|uniref:Uncharacterized protein n=1 Tax=Panaeolus cyanescens TaxID=181874 RepID=A0A409VZA6_9AGAR|nr:hypothetical protein CVT24_006457 [Panaeolus cyanescens]
MARFLRTTTRQRNQLYIIAFIVVCFLFIVTDHLADRHTAVNLDDVYDRPLEFNTGHDGPADSSAAVANSTRILIVTALFPLKRAKNGYDAYPGWVNRFLGSITTDVYFFCNEENAQMMRDLRRPGLPLIIDTTFDSPFDTPPLKGLEAQYRKMHMIDRERSYHSPELYAVWNAKPFFVDYATKLLARQGKHYDYIFWSDAGSFREDHVFKNWPYGPRVEQVWREGAKLTGTPKEDLLFYPIYNPPPAHFKNWKAEDGPLDVDFSEGSFFGGSAKANEWWAKVFYGYHDYCISQGFMCGKDQTVFNAVFMLFPKRMITVWVYDPDAPAHGGLLPYINRGFLGACGPEWYYYQWWLSDRTTRDEMRALWLRGDREPWEARWWKVREPCRFTRVLSMVEVIRRTFKDKKWEPPLPLGIDFPDRDW